MKVDAVIGSAWSPSRISYFRESDTLDDMLALLSERRIISCPVYMDRERIRAPEDDEASDLDSDNDSLVSMESQSKCQNLACEDYSVPHQGLPFGPNHSDTGANDRIKAEVSFPPITDTSGSASSPGPNSN